MSKKNISITQKEVDRLAIATTQDEMDGFAISGLFPFEMDDRRLNRANYDQLKPVVTEIKALTAFYETQIAYKCSATKVAKRLVLQKLQAITFDLENHLATFEPVDI
jgi:hypothetical protein